MLANQNLENQNLTSNEAKTKKLSIQTKLQNIFNQTEQHPLEQKLIKKKKIKKLVVQIETKFQITLSYCYNVPINQSINQAHLKFFHKLTCDCFD